MEIKNMQMPKNFVVVTEENFKTEVLESELPVIVAVGADWCPDCRRAAPFYMNFANQYEGKMRFASIDSDKNPKLKEELGVLHIPTMIVFSKGKAMEETLVEVQTPSELKAFIEKGIEFAG